ncbi:MAG: nicotinate-nucleotide adenylyltransferase [Clostridiales bacterium]|nr:nicotinate-nucleotide adenylyltransferase [Clostridiales bacterium]
MSRETEFFKSCRRIALMGGTFDPIHYGHLAAAEAVLQAYKPQRVLFVPSAAPPHKKNRAVTDAEHRYRMALLATAAHPAFEVSRLELDRPGPSYTVDTVRELRSLCPPAAEIFFIIGADTAEEIKTWKEPETLLALCEVVAVTRPGFKADALARDFKGRVRVLETPAIDISGTEIRRRAAAGESARYRVPPPVAEYIRDHRLYTNRAGIPAGFDFESAKATLADRLSPDRFRHTLGVIEAAEELSARFGADAGKARIAALLHDCAKEYSNGKKRALCQLWNIPTDDILLAQIDLAHSLLSAESAKRDYGVYDGEILQAIRYHTTGHGAMTALDKAVMLADFIEPYREDYPGLGEIRELSRISMEEALVYGITSVIQNNEDRKRLIHPWSKAALKSLTSKA